jgi:hypothetical protein
MDNLKVYESFAETEAPADVHFEIETSDFNFVPEGPGDYVVRFKNSEGVETSINVSPVDIDEAGDEGIGELECIEGTSTDGKQYIATGHYRKATKVPGSYQLKGVLLEEV